MVERKIIGVIIMTEEQTKRLIEVLENLAKELKKNQEALGYICSLASCVIDDGYGNSAFRITRSLNGGRRLRDDKGRDITAYRHDKR